MDVRPFKLLNESERGWLARNVRTAMGEWLAAWMPAVTAAAVRCTDPTLRAQTRLSAEPSHWLSFAHRDAALSIALGEEVERWLAEGLLGAERHSALVDGVIRAALSDLAGRLLHALHALHAGAVVPAAAEQPPAQHCWRLGSGAVIIEADFGERTIALVGSPTWVMQQLAARPRTKPPSRGVLADPRQCIGRARVSLQLWAGSASVEIGELRTLAPGDVIRLDARIDQPLPITVQERETGRRGYLGRAEDHRALQIAPLR